MAERPLECIESSERWSVMARINGENRWLSIMGSDLHDRRDGEVFEVVPAADLDATRAVLLDVFRHLKANRVHSATELAKAAILEVATGSGQDGSR